MLLEQMGTHLVLCAPIACGVCILYAGTKRRICGIFIILMSTPSTTTATAGRIFAKQTLALAYKAVAGNFDEKAQTSARHACIARVCASLCACRVHGKPMLGENDAKTFETFSIVAAGIVGGGDGVVSFASSPMHSYCMFYNRLQQMNIIRTYIL